MAWRWLSWDPARLIHLHLLSLIVNASIKSSNYDPCDAWTVGAQLVALNWQAWCEHIWINQAKVRGLASPTLSCLKNRNMGGTVIAKGRECCAK